MGTPCNVAVELEDGTFMQARSNYDGYPEHMIKQLTTYYNSQAAAEYLCSLHDFRGLYNGEPIHVYQDGHAPDMLDEPRKDEQYLYVFRDGEWQQWG